MQNACRCLSPQLLIMFACCQRLEILFFFSCTEQLNCGRSIQTLSGGTEPCCITWVVSSVVNLTACA